VSVRLSVTLSASISPKLYAQLIFTKFCACCVTVAWSSSGGVARPTNFTDDGPRRGMSMPLQ